MIFFTNLRKLRSLYPLSLSNHLRSDLVGGDSGVKLVRSKNGVGGGLEGGMRMRLWNAFDGARGMSARSMRSKVEIRMRREAGKTMNEIRRAKRLRKKLMTDEERLIFNYNRAKKKATLLLQRLKKYELPELPPPRHDPELLTPEQMQAFRKIGFKNKNYVPVGIRGVFGGVVQNMHMHWKFHETVQVCCDNFPKEKIKEMASMIARLSGGIVVNIHNVKTIIMFRGRNYRQPRDLIPLNTLTKRKALFKAKFEQALDSQKLNIKKIELELRRKGVNPEDPVAMASIQRVASTFFNAIDKKEGSPYVFQGDNQSELNMNNDLQQPQPEDESDQEELDRFIAEIEDAADKEFADEEAAEVQELGRLKYRNMERFGGRYRGFGPGDADEPDRYIRRQSSRNLDDRHTQSVDSDDEAEEDELGRHNYGNREQFGSRHRGSRMGDADEYDKDTRRQTRSSRNSHDRRVQTVDSDGEVENDEVWNANESHDEDIDEVDNEEFSGASKRSSGYRIERLQKDNHERANNNRGFKRETVANSKERPNEEQFLSEDMLSDLDDVMFESDDEKVKNTKGFQSPSYNYKSRSDNKDQDGGERSYGNEVGDIHHYHRDRDASEEDFVSVDANVGESRKLARKDEEGSRDNRKLKNSKEVDETWDSD